MCSARTVSCAACTECYIRCCAWYVLGPLGLARLAHVKLKLDKNLYGPVSLVQLQKDLVDPGYLSISYPVNKTYLLVVLIQSTMAHISISH